MTLQQGFRTRHSPALSGCCSEGSPLHESRQGWGCEFGSHAAAARRQTERPENTSAAPATPGLGVRQRLQRGLRPLVPGVTVLASQAVNAAPRYALLAQSVGGAKACGEAPGAGTCCFLAWTNDCAPSLRLLIPPSEGPCRVLQDSICVKGCRCGNFAILLVVFVQKGLLLMLIIIIIVIIVILLLVLYLC